MRVRDAVRCDAADWHQRRRIDEFYIMIHGFKK